MHSTVRGGDLILSASYSTKPQFNQPRKIYKGSEIGVDFECGYSMADQVIDESYTVTGEKLVASRRHQVIYKLLFWMQHADYTSDVFISFVLNVPNSPFVEHFNKCS